MNIVSKAALKHYAESFRDWGRDCWCASGVDNSCRKRYAWQLGELPEGYDHKYIYSHLGYNLKPLDVQAAIGRKQLLKLPRFIEARKRNWEVLRRGLEPFREVLNFTLPTHARRWVPPSAEGAASAASQFEWDDSGCRSDCSWFGFMIFVKPEAPFTHVELGRHLEQSRIGSRMLFGGNLLRQPVFVQLRKERPEAIRVVGETAGADQIMRQAIFLGTYPGLSPAMLEHEIACISEFIKGRLQK